MPTPCDSVIRVTLDGKTDAFPVNTTVQTVISRLLDAPAAAAVLGVMQGGVCRELNESLTKDCELTSLTYRDEEGRRIYERSLRFLMLAATLRLHPGRRVRVLNSVGYGLYVRLESELTHAQVREIEAEMRRMAEADLPFEKEHWTREQAVQYFEKMGWTDKAELMRYRPRREIMMYRMGGLCEYFYGAMLPSTGWVKTFSLKPHFPGMVLMMPSPADPSQSAKYHPHTKFLRVFGQSQEWCHILGANNAADVNRMIQEGKPPGVYSGQRGPARQVPVLYRRRDHQSRSQGGHDLRPVLQRQDHLRQPAGRPPAGARPSAPADLAGRLLSGSVHPAAGERRKARSGIHRRAGRAPFDRKPGSTAQRRKGGNAPVRFPRFLPAAPRLIPCRWGRTISCWWRVSTA